MDKIDNLRQTIDILDDKIMQLLEERFSFSIKIGELKTLTKTAILNTERENIILNKIIKYSYSSEINAVYKTIMKESKLLQGK